MNTHLQTAVARPSCLTVENLSVRYEGDVRNTVEGCSFSLASGELMLMTGPSGCGKSTLAMAIAGVIPRSVEAEVGGRIALTNPLTQPGKIGYLFQDPESQFCMRHVADELAFGLENLEVAREDMPKRIQHSLELVGLDVPMFASHAKFSGGMKQKLAIATALAMDGDLFIFDEPTANLDPSATRTVFEQTVGLRRQGKTVIVIEHKYEPLLPYIDKVLEMSRDGQIEGVYDGATWMSILDSRDTDKASVSWKKRSSVSGSETDEAHQGARPDHVRHDGKAEPVLEIHSASLAYDGRNRVWEDVQLKLFRGEWVAIVGPNGAGKSSLLEVMAGLRKPTHGDVQLRGTPISKVSKSSRYRTISYGFQNPEYQFLYERVVDEMAGCLVGDNVPSDVRIELDEYGLGHLAEASPYALSQGQKRRLAVGVMLRKGGDICLFDEPTYGQDTNTELLLLNKLKAKQRSGGAVVTVTHDMEMVRRWATRVVVLADGGVLYDGGVDGLFVRQDVLKRAHLIDDCIDMRDQIHDGAASQSSAQFREASASNASVAEFEPPRTSVSKRSPLGLAHPGLKAASLVIVATLALFSTHFAQLERFWALVLVCAFGMGWCNPWKMFIRLSPAIAAYVIYLWTFAANAAVPQGVAHVDWLWFHISWYGMWKGVLVALRTLSTVVLAYVVLVTTDGTDFVVSLSQTFRVTPKLSYGVMAGTGFLGRLQHDIEVLRMARSLRGRQGWWIFQPVAYVLPVLSQSVRMSERMAIAMEARGFYGPPSQSASRRTYFRVLRLRAWDIVLSVALVSIAVLLLFV